MKKWFGVLYTLLLLVIASPIIAQQLTSWSQPSIVQMKSNTTAAGTSVSITLAQPPTSGDVLFCGVTHDGTTGTTLTWPSGFTSVRASINAGSLVQDVRWHLVSGGDPSTYVVSSSASADLHLGCYEVVNLNTTTPVNASIGYTSTSSSATKLTGLVTLTAPATSISFWGTINGSTGYTPNGSFYDYDAAAGTMNAHGQHSRAYKYFATTPMQDTLTYSSTPTDAVATVVGINPIIDPFTISTVAIVATPTPAPTPTPGPTSAYTYHGCQVFASNDWFTTNLATGGSTYATNTVDPNSTTVMNYLQSTYGNIAWYSPAVETVNIASNATTLYTDTNGTIHNDPYNDDPSNVIPFSNTFWAEGGPPPSYNCAGDCHVIVLNTDTCVDYETYVSGIGSSLFGPPYKGGNGFVKNLNFAYNTQMLGGGIDAGNIPMVGTTAFGEETAAQNSGCQPNCNLGHSLSFQMPINSGSTNGMTAPYPTNGNVWSCKIYCTHTVKMDARFVLRASFTCPSYTTYPQANLICNTLKTFGMIYNDTAANSCTVNGVGAGYCVFSIRMGTSSNGTNPWHGDGCCGGAHTADLDQLFAPNGANYMHISDFQLMLGGGS